MDQIKQFCLENLRHLQHSPSVQMQDISPDAIDYEENMMDEDSRDPDVRNHQDEIDSRLVLVLLKYFIKR